MKTLEDVIKGDPKRYELKFSWGFWIVQTIVDRHKVRQFFLWQKEFATTYCDMLNAVYSLGYLAGVKEVLDCNLDHEINNEFWTPN